MTTIAEVERAVEQLSPEEMLAFREWFAQRDAVEWDRQFEQDVAAGRLEALRRRLGAASGLGGAGARQRGARNPPRVTVTSRPTAALDGRLLAAASAWRQ